VPRWRARSLHPAAWVRHLQFSPLKSIVVTEWLQSEHSNLANPFKGPVLDGSHQRIVSLLPSRRNSGYCIGQETDARPTEFTLGMDRRRDHHCGNVRRGHRHVCCIACRVSLPSSRAFARFAKLIVRTVQFGLDAPILPGLPFIYRAYE